MTRHPLGRRVRRVLAGATLFLAVGAAAAAAPSKELPNVVAPLTVAPRGNPAKIVTSFPAAGEVIAPGALVMRITFDQKMDSSGFAFTAGANAKMPDCLKTPRLLNDEKTFVLLCTTAPDTAYSIVFNANRQGGFANLGGTPALSAGLAFGTNNEDGPRDVDDALKISKLTRADVPIATQP